MTAARHRIGTASTVNRICSACTDAAAGRPAKGPRPYALAQMAMRDVLSSARLAPPGPKRTVINRINGRRNTTTDAPGMLPGRSINTPKTHAPTITRATASSAASTRRARGAPRSQAGPAVTAMMMAGPSISSVSTFEKKRVRQTSQYGSPCTTVTAAASSNDDRNGATRPAATMKTVARALRHAAVGGEQRQHKRDRPRLAQLRDQVSRQRREQVDPPAPRRSQQKRRREDRIGRPEDRRRRRRKPQDEAEVGPDVVRDGDQERGRRGVAHGLKAHRASAN